MLPADKVRVFKENLANQDQKALASWEVYRPKRGDTLGKIAKQFKVPITHLKGVNGIPSHSWQLPKLLVVPTNGDAWRVAVTLPLQYAPPLPAVRAVHTVRRGDALWAIAKRYGVTVAALKAWNRIGRHLQIGQKIFIRTR